MTSRASAQSTSLRLSKILLAALLVVAAGITATLGYQSLNSPSSTAASPAVTGISRQEGPPLTPTGVRRSAHKAVPPIERLGREHRGSLGVADGFVPAGTTIFDSDVPAVANLDPKLLVALRRAATDAADDGVELFVNSGWRSAKYQEHLLDDAVSKYGSREKAARWVATPNTSAHVSGDAVDLGHTNTPAWLSKHGAEYGLCETYRNEPWHYELRPEAITDGCPAMYADPTFDPRMQQ